MKSPTISNESVQKATGKSWEEWFNVLQEKEAQALGHKEIATLLHEAYGVDGWWAQGITVEFERTIGRREVGQTSAGDYQTAASRTISGTLDDALESWKKLVGEARDFNGVAFSGEPTTSQTDNWRYWHVPLADGSKVAAVIGNKGSGKALLAVNHEKLSDKDAVDRWKSFWKEFLQDL
jgi:hypothetical protein